MMLPDTLPCGWEMVHRFEAPDVPKPNLYQGMHQGSASSALAVTPAGVMGMPDDQVKAGKFDQPGMVGMGAMDMEKGHGMVHEEQPAPKAMEMHHGGAIQAVTNIRCPRP